MLVKVKSGDGLWCFAFVDVYVPRESLKVGLSQPSWHRLGISLMDRTVWSSHVFTPHYHSQDGTSTGSGSQWALEPASLVRWKDGWTIQMPPDLPVGLTPRSLIANLQSLDQVIITKFQLHPNFIDDKLCVWQFHLSHNVIELAKLIAFRNCILQVKKKWNLGRRGVGIHLIFFPWPSCMHLALNWR